jgi:hypothetical protein
MANIAPLPPARAVGKLATFPVPDFDDPTVGVPADRMPSEGLIHGSLIELCLIAAKYMP